MNLCVVSFKECWVNNEGAVFSTGGFPLQIKALGFFFEKTYLLTVQTHEKPGGICIEGNIELVPLLPPQGEGIQRKRYILSHLGTYFKKIAEYVKKSDVVYIPLPGDMPLLGMITAAVMGKKIIARYGGSWKDNQSTSMISRIIKFLMRFLAGGKNTMVATGAGSEPPAPNMHWIFSSTISAKDLLTIKPKISEGLSSPARLIYVGRLSPEKGVENLIKAVGRLKKEGLCYSLVIAGDGPERCALEELAKKLNCSERVIFMGQLDHQALYECLSKADFMVQPSLTEGFSKAWLDGMVHGIPVLTPNVGAAAAVIGENNERGWLIKKSSEDELVRMIKRIVLNKEHNWISLRKNCYEYAKDKTIEVWARNILLMAGCLKKE